MQALDNSISNPALSLSISEQLVFLIESTSINKLDNYSKEHYLFAVITGCIADLFLLDKIHFVQGRINLNNNPKKVSDYLTDIMRQILSNREEKSIFYILLAMNYRQMSQIESMIVDDLIDKKLLVREHEGFSIFGKSFLHANNEDFRFDLNKILKDGLNADEEPPMQIIFLLTLLDGIDLLPILCKSENELNYSRQHLESFIKNDHIAKLLLRAIQNEIKINDLENMPKHQGGGLGIGRMF